MVPKMDFSIIFIQPMFLNLNLQSAEKKISSNSFFKKMTKFAASFINGYSRSLIAGDWDWNNSGMSGKSDI